MAAGLAAAIQLYKLHWIHQHALALRYGWSPANAPLNCACGTHFSVEMCCHALRVGIHQSDTMKSGV